MEDLGEYIIPLIIAGIYFFSNLLTKKAKQKEDEQPTWEPPEFDIDENEDPIGEESFSSAGELSAYDRRQLERRQAAYNYREEREAEKNGTLLPPIRQEIAPPPIPELALVSDSYESTIEQQLKKIEETKRKAEQIKVQAGGTGAHPKSTKRPTTHRKASGSIRSQLQDPAAARTAFIYGEILGPCASSGERSKIPGLG